MAEDQGVNGDLWNDEASRLLFLFKWTQIGDKNVDVYNEDNKPHGIDTMLAYHDVRGNIDQGFFLEAKRYKTTSYNPSLLQGWIKSLDDKILKIRFSQNFVETYPKFKKVILQNGFIVIWFSDTDKYNDEYRKKFKDSLVNVKLPARTKSHTLNKIYVLENDGILRLCSMFDSISKLTTAGSSNIKFYYPSEERYKNPIDRSEVLIVDYMFSKIVLAETYTKKGALKERVVFYFGSLSFQSFQRLNSFLLNRGFVDKKVELVIYIYNRDDEFRKIRPDVEGLFDKTKVKFRDMEIFSQLPTFLKQNNEK